MSERTTTTGPEPLHRSRVLVCGGRDFEARGVVWEHLERVLHEQPFTTLVHGACPTGVDAAADSWARSHFLAVWRFPADWRCYGKPAGPLRNARMMREARPALVLAFPGNTGTEGMVKIALAAGAEVRRLS